jgi:hypothetical protein
MTSEPAAAGSDTASNLTGSGRPWSGELRSLVATFVGRALKHPDVHPAPPAAGDPELRRALSQLLDEPENDLYVTTGVRDAAYALARALRGCAFVVEAPGFSGVADALVQGGGRVTGAAWHEMTATRPQVRSAAGAETVHWLTPVARNPDGARVSATQRAALESQIRGGAVVVCNEIYRWHSAHRARVKGAVRVGSLSKVAGGGVRLGWISAPPPLAAAIVPKLVARPPTVWQRAWALLIREVGLDPFIEGPVASDLAARDAFLGEAARWSSVPGAADGISLLWDVSGAEQDVLAFSGRARTSAPPAPPFGFPLPESPGRTRFRPLVGWRRCCPQTCWSPDPWRGFEQRGFEMKDSPGAAPRTRQRDSVMDLSSAAGLPAGSLGGKVERVAWLRAHGFPVCDGFVVLPSLLTRLQEDVRPEDLADLMTAIDALAERGGSRFGPLDGYTVSVRPSFLADVPGRGHRYLEIGAPGGARAGGEPADARRATESLLRQRRRFAERSTAPWNAGAHLDLVAALAASGGDDPAGPQWTVIVQGMAPFRHRPQSGRGCVLTVEPSTGVPGLVGEFTPGDAPRGSSAQPLDWLRSELPQCYAQLRESLAELRDAMGHDVEVEFVVSMGTLFFFQVREAHVSPLARSVPHRPDDGFGSVGPGVVAHGVTASPGICRAPFHRLSTAGSPLSGIIIVDQLSMIHSVALGGIRGVIALQGSRYGHAASRLCRQGIPALTGLTFVDGVHPDSLEGATAELDAYRGTVRTGAK